MVHNHISFVISGPPNISTLGTNMTASKNSSVSLPCTVTGNPLPAITWNFKSVVNINRSIDFAANFSNVFIMIYGLLIQDLVKGNEGTYTCYAFNGIGIRNIEHNLKVRGRWFIWKYQIFVLWKPRFLCFR